MLVVSLTSLIVVIDQWTKQLIVNRFNIGETMVVIPGFFDLTHITNRGAAWGMFAGQTVALAVFAVVMLIVLVVFRHRMFTDSLVHRLAFACMVAGIVGNVLDRLRNSGAVIDFLDFYVGRHHWPAFNVADSSICIGVGLYLVSSFGSGSPAAALGDAIATPAGE